jgi:hypothetical protein
MWTKYGQLALYGNIEPPHTLHTLHHQCVDQTWPAFIVWQYRNHTYTTHPPSSMCGPNMVSLQGNIETTQTLHTLHHQCMDQIWTAFSVSLPHIDDGGCAVYVWFLYCHTMKADHIWSTHWWWRVCSVCVVSILPYNAGCPYLVHTLMMEGV